MGAGMGKGMGMGSDQWLRWGEPGWPGRVSVFLMLLHISVIKAILLPFLSVLFACLYLSNRTRVQIKTSVS